MTVGRGIRKQRVVHRRHEFLEFLATTTYRSRVPLNALWWSTSMISVKSPIPLACSVCDVESDVQMDHFLRTGRFACLCSERRRWAPEEARLLILKRIRQSRFEPRGFLNSSSAYAAKHVGAHTKLPLQCSDCGVSVCDTPISVFAKSLGSQCSCNNGKTENIVARFVQSTIADLCNDELEVNRGFFFPDCESQLGRKMPYDICLMNKRFGWVVLLIEVDGRQHFEEGSARMKASFAATQRNDLQKEKDAVYFGVPMLRVSQPSVWTESIPWRNFVSDAIVAAWRETLEVAVHCQPGESLYTTGRYVEQRAS